MNRRTLLSSIAAVPIAGCQAPHRQPPANPIPDEIPQEPFEFRELNVEYWPNRVPDRVIADELKYSYDEAMQLDIQTHDRYKGTHALSTATTLLDLAQCIYHGDADLYREPAKRYAQLVAEYATEDSEGNLFMPSKFGFALHGNDEHYIEGPRHGALGLGVTLGAFSRLYELTGDEWYLETAHKFFGALAKPRKSTSEDLWVTTADEDGYLWFEEYPTHPPAHTLNGKLFAIFGVNNYWQVSSSDAAKALMEQALTTVVAHFEDFRVPGDLSLYCLEHQAQSVHYHDIHIWQFNELSKLTKSSGFGQMADKLREDKQSLQQTKVVESAAEIKEKINHPGPYDTVTIKNGTYDLSSIRLQPKRPVTIVGESQDGVVLEAERKDSLAILGKAVTLQNLTLRGFGKGSSTFDLLIITDDVVVKDVTLEQSAKESRHGFDIRNGADCEISDFEVETVGQNEVNVRPGASGRMSNGQIDGNIVNDSEDFMVDGDSVVYR